MAASRLRDQSYLAQLYPDFAAAVRWLLDQSSRRGWDVYIQSGFRSMDEQRALYARGRSIYEQLRHVKKQGRDGSVTDAPPGYSPHNWGLAVDLGGKDAARAVALAKQAGFGTISWDPPHVEWPNWMADFNFS